MTRLQQISKTPKAELARMHTAAGGLLTIAEYLRWSKDELVAAVLEDESIDPRPQHYTGVEHGWVLDAQVGA